MTQRALGEQRMGEQRELHVLAHRQFLEESGDLGHGGRLVPAQFTRVARPHKLLDPAAVVGLNDGGAHTALICDATIPTYMLTHWVRDRADSRVDFMIGWVEFEGDFLSRMAAWESYVQIVDPEEKRLEASRDLGGVRWTQYLRSVTLQGATYFLEGNGAQAAK